jgi:hypothetical protein
VDLNMKSKMLRISLEKKISCWGKANCKEFQKKTKEFMLGHSALSQKTRLMWTSEWRATCKEFHWKPKDFVLGDSKM